MIWVDEGTGTPGTDAALCIDDSLPRHRVVVEALGRVVWEVLEADPDLARALGCSFA